jgi:trimethylamine--corrinoid protein Co-methyltransferase
MKPIDNFVRVLSDDELELLHQCTLQLLQDPGMRFDNTDVLRCLEKKGAKVDYSTAVVTFPPQLIEATIAMARKEEQDRQARGEDAVTATRQLTFSWHTPFMDRASPVRASMGGGCPSYYDHAEQETRYATAADFRRMVRLAEGIEQIVTVGNPVHYVREDDGSPVPPKMVAIKGAALVAEHSSKPGCTSCIDRRQVGYLVEIGTIVRGSAAEYLKRPLFVNIHDTESPLRMSRPESSIMYEMAIRGIGTFILPMALAGIAGPVSLVSNAIITAAEILGVWAASKAVNEAAPVEASAVCGVMNPVNGAVSFSAPENILIDLATAQLFRYRYGTRCSTGPGIIDAPIPGALSIFERTYKIAHSGLSGEPAFPVGILGGGVVFSPEQVMLDLDIANAHYRFVRGIGGDEFDEALELIREKGIGGLFVDTDHTVESFRETLWLPAVFERLKDTDIGKARSKDPVERAHEKWRQIVSDTDEYQIDPDRKRAIDEVVKKASVELSGLVGAAE